MTNRKHDPLPLSPAQRGMWFADKLSPDYSVNTAQYIEIRHAPGVLDIDLLIDCTYAVAKELETPYIRLTEVDGVPMQYVDVDYPQTVDRVDLRDADDPAAAALQWMREEYRRPLDLVNDQLVVAAVIQVADNHTIWYQRAHHLIIDGYAAFMTLRRILDRYNATRSGEVTALKPGATLSEIVEYEAAYEASSRRETDRAHWLERVGDLPEGVTLSKHRAGAPLSFDNVVVGAELDPDLQRRIEELGRSLNSSMAVVMSAAFSAYLARMSGFDDIVLTLPVTGRVNAKVKGSAGMVSNTVPIRVRNVSTRTGRDLIAATQLEFTGALRHQRYRSDDIRRDAGMDSGSMTFGPTINMVFFDEALAIEGCTLDYRILASGVLEDLLINLYQSGPDAPLVVDLHGNPNLYSTDDISLHHGMFIEFLEQFMDMMESESDESVVGSIQLMSDAEIAALTAPPVGAEPRTFRELLADSDAGRDHGSVALVGADVLTAAEVAGRANRLARELISRGVGPGEVVAVMMPRSQWSVIASMAIVKTGAAFVSIDPRLPVERREMMLTVTGARLGLATIDTERARHDGTDWILIDDPAVEERLSVRSGTGIADHELRRLPLLDDAAYLIFTSGSTGLPKATVVPNRGVANVVENLRSVLGMGPEARVLHVASLSFDASVLEMLMALASGGSTVVADVHTFAGQDLERRIADQSVTHALLTPSALATLDPAAVPTLQTVFSGGEACPPDLMRRWTEDGRAFYNLYGPTEVTIWSTCDGPFSPDDEVTIGNATPGVGALVLDSALQPTRDGVVGELYLTGDQLALGYLQRPGQTVTSFVANPYASGRRMYRTGDRVARRADGRLDYRGRADFQLKVRGMRIEPGEVDSVLRLHPAVANATSLGVNGPAGDTVLVSYVSLVDGESVTPDQLRQHAIDLLPPHMVPRRVEVIDSFPMTVVGKIDRTRLPAIDFTESKDFLGPRNALEGDVAAVFADVLDLERVSVDDTFFELGGTSLSAAKLAARLSQQLGRTVTLKEVFNGGTVAGVAEAISKLADSTSGPALKAREHTEPVPVSEAQRGTWLVNQADPESTAYNLPLVLRLVGELDVTALQMAIGDLLERQQALRTRYPMIGGVPVMMVERVDEVLSRMNLDPVQVNGPLSEAIAELTERGFDVVNAAPISVGVLRVAADDHVLVFLIHHIAADGSSMAPLAHDFMTAYQARRAGHAPSWLPLQVQYPDYAEWQDQRLATVGEDALTLRDAQLKYWRERLAGAPETIDLPADRPRPAEQSGRGGTIHFEIPGTLVDSLEAIGRKHNATLFMVMHAALAVLLTRLSGRNEVVIGTPHAGRGHAALDELVGMFVNTLALRSAVDPRISFGELLDRVRADDLADMANADVAFESVVGHVGAATTLAFNPVYQVVFSFQNLDFPTVALDQLIISAMPEEEQPAKVDLHLTLFPNDPIAMADGRSNDGMRAEMLYSADLFEEPTVQVFADRFSAVLEAIAADPEVVVGDISIATVAEASSSPEDDDTPAVPLSDLVAEASQVAPTEMAFEVDGTKVDFVTLSVMTDAMAAAMPDSEAAMTTALMTVAPAVASGGAELLGSVLKQLRDRAETAIRDTESVK